MFITVDSKKASDILTGPIIDLITSDAMYASCDILHEEFVGEEYLDIDANKEFYDYEHPTSMEIYFLDLIQIPNIIVESLNDRVRITKSINELLSLYYTVEHEREEIIEQITDSVYVCLSDGGYNNGDIIRNQLCGEDKTIISGMVEQYAKYCSLINLEYSVPLTHFNGKMAVVVSV